MISKDQFQTETYDYMTRDEGEARAKAEDYNKHGVAGATIVAVKFGEHWCLMLEDAFKFVQEMGIDGKS